MRHQNYSQSRSGGSNGRLGIFAAVAIAATVALCAGPVTLIGGSLVVLGAAIHG